MFQLIRNNRSLGVLPLWLALTAVLAGCAVGPNYHKPAVDVPTAYRQPPEENTTTPAAANTQNQTVSGSSTAASLGDEKWWEVFQDKELQGLIERP